jgi:uncharacterized membrane protein
MYQPISVISRAIIAGLLVSGSSVLASAQDTAVDYHKTIKPLFEKYCLDCHGEEEPEAFRIDLKADAMDYITPGDAEDSQMYEVLVTDDESTLMPPPDEENPMSAEEIRLVKDWINQGAKWPGAKKEQAPDRFSAPPTSAEPKKELVPLTPKPSDLQETKSVEGKRSSEAKSAQSPAAETGLKQAEPNAKQETALKDKADQRIFRAIGSLHPAAIHLPIGLLLAAGLFSLLSLRGNFVMSDCAYYCLWLGALGCIVACLTGWWAAPMKFRTEGVKEIGDLLNQDHRVFWHRTGGLIVAVVSLVLAMFAASARNRDPDDGMLWKLCLIILAAAVGWVGHEGGKLTYGKYHYKDLIELGREWFLGVFGQNVAPKEESKSTEEKPSDAEPQKDVQSDESSVET